MTSFYKTITAVCLVASSGLQSVAGSDPTYRWAAEDVTADVCMSVNLARNGKLPVHINEVAKDDDLVTSLKNTIENKGSDATSCAKFMEGKETLKDVFHSALSSPDERNYPQLLQTSLDEGLKVFKTKAYPQSDSEWQKTWEDAEFANLAYLLSSNSTKVGCVIGKCIKETVGPTRNGEGQAAPEIEMTVLFCDLDPAATKNKAPFDEDYFTGLIARTAKLASMTEDDLKTPSNDAAGTVAVSSIVFAGLVTMLTAVAA
ncbi:SAG family member [Eimeria brunetti]|uniref:SAG family member n=1 Tax=Eimeria brunetti TaxID=51314 RepID=U6LAL9_9EIME|nr:SAG family member [Eimeria brunetti]